MSQLDYLYGLQLFSPKYTLENMQKLVEVLSNPQNLFKSIHITGTNGKGSTSAMTAAILQQAGYKVGLYTSPHLISFNERIRINGKEISNQELNRYIKKIRDIIEKQNLTTTFFELTTALAFLHFAEQKVDFAVIEVGLGGRLDATNVVMPKVSVITNVSLDHTKTLGFSLQEIATEKAGIIKEHIPVVVGAERKEVLDVIKKVAQQKQAPLHLTSNQTYELSLKGEYQQKNARCAALVCELLGVKKDDIRLGLKKTIWLARLQWVTKNILVDCAHNVAGITSLVHYLSTVKQRKKVLLLALSHDKKIDDMTKEIVPLFDIVVVTQGNHKPMNADEIATKIQKFNKEIIVIKNPKNAFTKAKNLAKDDLLVVAGSMYMVGDVLQEMKS